MNIYLLIGLLAYNGILCAQTKFEKSIPVPAQQQLEFNFEFPQLTFQTWDKQEVLVKGTVSINKGEHDNTFDVQVEKRDNIVSITGIIKDKDNIPHRIVIKKDDREYYFKTNDYNSVAVQKFLEDNGKEYAYISHGLLIDIKLEIFVPKGMSSKIKSKFGLVEVKKFEAPLSIDAEFGGIDATITETSTGDLMVKTQHGEILSNLDVKFNSSGYEGHHDHWTEISAKPGIGPTYNLESKFGKVYLRKPNKG